MGCSRKLYGDGATDRIHLLSNFESEMDIVMRKLLGFASTATFAVSLLTGCGSATPAEQGGGRPISTVDRDQPVSTADGVPAPEVVEPPSPQPEQLPPVPPIAKPMNNNKTNTPIGKLCWSRREALLVLVREMPATANAANKVVQVESVLGQLRPIAAQLKSIDLAELPVELHAFVARFRSDVDLIINTVKGPQETTLQVLVDSFDFEHYPNIERYVSIAGANPDCRDA